MRINLFSILFIILFLSGCFGSFKRKPQPIFNNIDQVIVAPEISLQWKKIIPLISSKDQIINLIGHPDFIDNHKTGEDWYYSHHRSVDYGLISFPSSGHLIDHVQYIKYPEWK